MVLFLYLVPLDILLFLVLIHVHAEHLASLVACHPPKMDATGVCKPNIVTIVLQKLSMHLQYLKFFGLFDIVAYF